MLFVVISRSIEAQARIRIPKTNLSEIIDKDKLGTDFTLLAIPLPNRVLLICKGHELFATIQSIQSGDRDVLEDISDSISRSLLADSSWTVPATFEANKNRYALSLGMTAVHLGFIPAVGKKVVVRLRVLEIELWQTEKWLTAAEQNNAGMLGI